VVKQLSAEDIAEQVCGLGEVERKNTVDDILGTLPEFVNDGPFEGDEDTWVSGFNSAMDVIRSNYPHSK
jgi:hypothetical protein